MTRPSLNLALFSSQTARRLLSFGAAFTFFASATLPLSALADTVLMPRLGFPSQGPKRLYFDVSESAQKDLEMFKSNFQKNREAYLKRNAEKKATEAKEEKLTKLKEAAYNQLSPEEQQRIEKADAEKLSEYEEKLNKDEVALKEEKDKLDDELGKLKDHEKICRDLDKKLDKYEHKLDDEKDKEEPSSVSIQKNSEKIAAIEKEQEENTCDKVDTERAQYDRKEKEYYKRLKAYLKKRDHEPDSTFSPDEEELLAKEDILLPEKDKKKKEEEETIAETSTETEESRLALEAIPSDSEHAETADGNSIKEEEGRSWINWLNPLDPSPWYEDPHKRLRGDFILIDIRHGHPLYDKATGVKTERPDKPNKKKKENGDAEATDKVAETVSEDIDQTETSQAEEKPARFFIEFKDIESEGTYDLALRGTGLRAEGPIKVSDDLYWDALQLVLQDFSEGHCTKSPGEFIASQRCSMHTASLSEVDDPMRPAMTTQVRGGWYLSPKEMHLNPRIPFKSTPDIAFISQTLLKIYLLNPASYDYADINGIDYKKSRYPDLLDEANWGLQYLLSVQYPDGSFSNGLTNRNNQYYMLPSTPKSTALSTLVLASAAKAFRKKDLSYSLLLLKHAEKGVKALQDEAKTAKNPAEYTKWLYIASLGVSKISKEPIYTKLAKTYEGIYPTLPAQIQFMASTPTPLVTIQADPEDDEKKEKPKDDEAVSEENAETVADATVPLTQEHGEPPKLALSEEYSLNSAQAPFDLIPYLNSIDLSQTQVSEPLAQWVNGFYGYEPVYLVRDDNFKVDAVLSDPLEWMAYKTGEYITRYNVRLDETGLSEVDASTTTLAINELAEKEEACQKRLEKGYSTFDISLTERAMLAYTLAVLNQQLRPATASSNEDEAQEGERYLSF